jgi:hypothetical protein
VRERPRCINKPWHFRCTHACMQECPRCRKKVSKVRRAQRVRAQLSVPACMNYTWRVPSVHARLGRQACTA